MFIFSNLISLSNKLVAYNFVNDSGLNSTAKNSGFSDQPTVYSMTSTIITTVLSLLGVIFLGLLIYGGITWMTAEGDEAKVEKAQGIIRDSIIGLVITLSAYAISVFVIGALSSSVTP